MQFRFELFTERGRCWRCQKLLTISDLYTLSDRLTLSSKLSADRSHTVIPQINEVPTQLSPSCIGALVMMTTRRMLLLSNSTLHNGKYLEWAKPEILDFLGRKNVTRVLFVPYASFKHDDYTNEVRKALEPWGLEVEGIHTSPNPVQAVESAESIFIGGGNTFLLLKTLYSNGLLAPIQKKVLENGTPYIGSSAGTNVATVSINTTNDMPIVYPPSFSALNLIPFNINPHYMDPDPNSKHMGETREKRISEYLEMESSPPVLGLREGSLLAIEGQHAVLKGHYKARLFVRGKEPKEYEVGSDLSFLL